MSEPETVKEAIELWDKGGILWTIECGGFGPGYEQALQVGVIELLRALMDKPLPDPPPNDWGDKELSEASRRCNLGLSGSQAGAIKWLAYAALRDGWKARNDRFREKCKEKGEEDRMIQISKHWPAAPELTPQYMTLSVGEVS